jgi:hypothetical protein
MIENIKLAAKLSSLSFTTASVYSQAGAAAAGGAAVVTVLALGAIIHGTNWTFSRLNAKAMATAEHAEKFRLKITMSACALAPCVAMCAASIFFPIAIPTGITALGAVGLLSLAVVSAQLYRCNPQTPPPPPSFPPSPPQQSPVNQAPSSTSPSAPVSDPTPAPQPIVPTPLEILAQPYSTLKVVPTAQWNQGPIQVKSGPDANGMYRITDTMIRRTRAHRDLITHSDKVTTLDMVFSPASFVNLITMVTSGKIQVKGPLGDFVTIKADQSDPPMPLVIALKPLALGSTDADDFARCFIQYVLSCDCLFQDSFLADKAKLISSRELRISFENEQTGSIRVENRYHLTLDGQEIGQHFFVHILDRPAKKRQYVNDPNNPFEHFDLYTYYKFVKTG